MVGKGPEGQAHRVITIGDTFNSSTSSSQGFRCSLINSFFHLLNKCFEGFLWVRMLLGTGNTTGRQKQTTGQIDSEITGKEKINSVCPWGAYSLVHASCRASYNDGNAVSSARPHVVATGHMRLLVPWNASGMTRKWNFSFYFIN